MLNYLFSSPKNSKTPPQLVIETENLKKHYAKLVAQQAIDNDLAQLEILTHLQQLLDKLAQQIGFQQQKQTRLQKLFAETEDSIKSVYIFGDVGRGKSMLMELFYEACPIKQKRRVHFHSFMLEVHEFVHQWRKKHDNDPYLAYATHLRHSIRLLCFDEFQVTNIADAMIITRLFNQLFAQNLIIVATSNAHPNDLYKDGLQRELFLPFIQSLKNTAQLLELKTQEDYRLIHFNALNYTFHIGLGNKAEAFLKQSFADLSHGAMAEKCYLQVKGRKLIFKAGHGDILYSSFDELCNRTLGSADYIEISTVFKTVFIANIPQLSIEIRDQAQRFVTLIDALYEANVKLICTAEVSVESLSIEEGIFDFKRTQSRLMEMQSTQYMQRRQSLKLTP